MISNPIMNLFYLNCLIYQNFYLPSNSGAIKFSLHIPKHSQSLGAALILIRRACGSVGAQQEPESRECCCPSKMGYYNEHRAVITLN